MWTWWVSRSSSAPVNRSDQAMTLAVVDHLVHHATIFEMNVESYRRRAALERKRGFG
jgi:IstB-like ATP binding protein